MDPNTTSSPSTTTSNFTWVWSIPQATPMTPDEWSQRVHTAMLFGVLCCIGIVLNALPILFTFCTQMRKNNVHVMVGSLSTADFVFCLMFICGQTQYILYKEYLNSEGCRWLAWLTFITAFFDFIFPPLISINRYISLYYSEHYKHIYTTRNVIFMIIGSWVFCTIIPFIFALGGQTGFDEDNLHCCIVVKYSHWAWTFFYWVIIIVPLIAFCDGAMMFCNYKIYKKLLEHKKTPTLKNNVMKQNRELFYFLVADMTFPILFHTTYHVTKFVAPNRTNIASRRFFTCLYLINSCVRGLVTLCMLRPYRQSLRNLVCFWKKPNIVAPLTAISTHVGTAYTGRATTPIPMTNCNDW